MAHTPYYKLIGRLPVPVPVEELELDWGANGAFDIENRRVAETKIGPLRVSTVFLAMNHNWSMDPDSPPILFETMVFGAHAEGEYAESYCDRYSTWDEAEKGHERAVEYARRLLG